MFSAGHRPTGRHTKGNPLARKESDRLTFEQAAVRIGCSVRTVERLKQAGLIGYGVIGIGNRSSIYFTPEDVDAYIATTRHEVRIKPKKSVA